MLPNEQQIRDQFENLRPELEKWGTNVDTILCEFLNKTFTSHERVQMQPTHRIKETDSYCEKVLIRKPKENPLLETTDKVGTRVVLLNSIDVKVVCEFIENSDQWKVQEHSQDTNHIIQENPEAFTYQSEHYIVRPKEDYSAGCALEFLTCEIQIRTILQHAYAEISHDTMYKKHISLSNEYKRKLASAMAFLEATDEKFVQIYKGVNDYNDHMTDLQRLMIKYYRSVETDYDDSKYNVEITLPLLREIDKNIISDFCDGIDNFMQTKLELVRSSISTYKGEDILFKHPVIILALYMITNYQTTLLKYWPYPYESLRHVVRGMNMSEDILQ